MTFSTIYIDFRLKVCLLLLVVGMYITIVLVPSTFGNSIPIAINEARRQFENIAFKKSTSLTIKQKINLISDLSDKAGFSCYSWFRLSSFVGLKVSRRRNNRFCGLIFFLHLLGLCGIQFCLASAHSRLLSIGQLRFFLNGFSKLHSL